MHARRPRIGLTGIACALAALGLVPPAGVAEGAVHAFASSGPITIPESGNATPFPSTITVSGLTTGTVARVRVLMLLTHGFPRDVDIVLRAPAGEDVVLMADVGGGDPLTSTLLSFDDCAISSVPALLSPTATAYRPTNAGAVSGGVPAPTGATLSSFASRPAGAMNGVWSLYVQDDTAFDGGEIATWVLLFWTSATPVPAVVCGADFDQDGVPDIIASAGPGGGPHVQVLSGATGAPIRSFFAYDPGVTSGVRTTACDFNGDGIPDIVTVPGPGGAPHVRVFDGSNGNPLGGVLGSGFFPYDPGFVGGAFLTCGDFNLDGVPDIVVAPGPGGGPHVRVFDGRNGQPLAGVLGSGIFAYDPGFTGGVFLGP
jgi:subtilisin-like proprotein convertase family protein